MKLLKPVWIWTIFQFFGIRWIIFRGFYEIKKWINWQKIKTPRSSWNEHSLESKIIDKTLLKSDYYLKYRCKQIHKFFFVNFSYESINIAKSFWDSEKHNPIRIADLLKKGKIQYFSNRLINTGFPPKWHQNYITGHTVSNKTHWSKIDEFKYGDIKNIWEPNRYAFVYALVRSYFRTGDEKYPKIFWELVEDWRSNNLPNCGVNWKCGQEISFRIMAWCFGLYGFINSKATTNQFITHLAQMIAVSGERIESNIQYALSQKNNHAISEAVGLWTIGCLFPELKSAERWMKLGRKILETQAEKLIFKKGSFSQNSMNYHRLMLQNYIWSIRLGDINGNSFSPEIKKKVHLAGEWLFNVQFGMNGEVPNYGQNDGALILPLNNCNYNDYRPVIQTIMYLTKRKRCYPEGPWDEDLLWLFGPNAIKTQISHCKKDELKDEGGGYFTINSKSSSSFIRCVSFKYRPGQADLLHTDIWYKGIPIAIDPGTFSYNAPDPWNNPLSETQYHNTVSVDDKDQMDRVEKFIWLPWANGKLRASMKSMDSGLNYWEGDHEGYLRLKKPVLHQRGIIRIGDYGWLVLDALSSYEKHKYRLHWLLADLPFKWENEKGIINLNTKKGCYYIRTGSVDCQPEYSLVKGDENSPRGWNVPYYNYREPALSFASIIYSENALFYSCFTNEPCNVKTVFRNIKLIADSFQLSIQLKSPPYSTTIVKKMSLKGKLKDLLEVSAK